MRFRARSAVLFVLIALNAPATAWNYKGHEITGSVADSLLGPNAKQQIAAILGFDLRTAGPWADCARNVTRLLDGTFKYAPAKPEYRLGCAPFEAVPSEVARLEDYISRNWSNCFYLIKHECDEAYHFTDVAIQRDDYSRSYVGTGDHDVVGAIDAAVAVLQGRPTPLPFSIRDKKEAIFLLAHFVGDLHQPLHVGAIYLDHDGRPVDPDIGKYDPSTLTAGGNLILDQGNNFHSEWDAIPDDLGETANDALVAKGKGVPATKGPVENFATMWASESVVASRSAFAGLTFGPIDTRGDWSLYFVDREAYWNRQNGPDGLKRDQLAKGGAHLAELLNAIWPSPPAAPAPERVTACSTIKICYCVNKQNLSAISANLALIRQHIADRHAEGKMIGYLSIPLSTAGGSYVGVNRDVAQRIKDGIEKRLGAVWVLNPGAEGNLPESATGADYMYMWTQVLEGRGGLGEDFDFVYFAGPSDFAHFFSLTGTDDSQRVDDYFDQRISSDVDLMNAVASGKLSKAGFRRYYSLRASVAFSSGSHDEWNIYHKLNEVRRASPEFGIANQIGLLFDGHGLTPGSFEDPVSNGYAGSCNP